MFSDIYFVLYLQLQLYAILVTLLLKQLSLTCAYKWLVVWARASVQPKLCHFSAKGHAPYG